MKYKYLDELDENGREQHLHLLDVGEGYKPLTGTSSVENVLAKVLTWWASGLACQKFGWLDPKKNAPEAVKIALQEGYDRVKGLSLAEYGKLLGEAYKAHSVKLDKSAKTGTDLHKELQKFVMSELGKWNFEDDELDPKIKPYIDWSRANVKQYLWSEAYCFDENLWVGGISDTGAELNNGQLAVLDFKSANKVYPNHFIQAAGYATEIEKNGLWDKNGEINKKLDKKIDALIIVPFGAEEIIPEVRFDVEAYKKGFEWCVGLYRLLGLDKSYGNI